MYAVEQVRGQLPPPHKPQYQPQGLAIPKNERDPKITGLLNSLLVKLEATKPDALLAGEQADKAYLEDFALKVFHRADKVDRAGLADKKTAVTYLASFYFFEVGSCCGQTALPPTPATQILAQFGELAPDVAEKQRYAAWRAADINKALREGRTPTPVPTADELDAIDDAQPAAIGDQGAANLEDDEEEDFGLPKPPSTQHPPPPAPALPPMRAGSRVLYMDADVGGQAVRGTVAKADGDTLHVALSDRIVTTSRAQLVFELQMDDDACYYHAGNVETCSVEAVDLQHWCAWVVNPNLLGTHPCLAQAALLHGADAERQCAGRVGGALGPSRGRACG